MQKKKIPTNGRSILDNATLAIVCLLTVGVAGISYYLYTQQKKMNEYMKALNVNMTEIGRFIEESSTRPALPPHHNPDITNDLEKTISTLLTRFAIDDEPLTSESFEYVPKEEDDTIGIPNIQCADGKCTIVYPACSQPTPISIKQKSAPIPGPVIIEETEEEEDNEAVYEESLDSRVSGEDEDDQKSDAATNNSEPNEEKELKEEMNVDDGKCTYVFKRGPRANEKCTIKASENGRCSKHKR